MDALKLKMEWVGLDTRKEHAVQTPRKGPRPPFGLLIPPPLHLKSQLLHAMRAEGKKEAKEKRLSHASSDNEFSWFSRAVGELVSPDRLG